MRSFPVRMLSAAIARAALVARANPCREAPQGRPATPVQSRLTYPNYAKEMPHLFT